MNKVLVFLKEHKYLMVALVLVGISITLGVTYSNYIVTSNNHKAAEMYIGTLKYSMTIDGTTTNTLSVPSGETIVDVTITNENPIDTYYKLIYQNNSNITIKYYESIKDTNDNVTNCSSPNDKITSSGKNTIKLKITNSSTSSQTVTFKIVGGFATNTLNDVIVPAGYTIIEKDTSTNTYFCTTTDTLTQGLKYVNGQYTYAYKQQGRNASSGIAWDNINNNGWGVQLTDKASTDAVTSNVCTYINNKPIISMSYMFYKSQATTLDASNFDTSKVTNMYRMFDSSQATTLDLSTFNTSKVTNMSYMFNGSTSLNTIYVSDKFVTTAVTSSTSMFGNMPKLVGGNGTKYNSSYVDKTYAHIDGGTSNPGYFTDIADKDIPAPNSFATDSWKTIIKAVRNNNISKYNVGDTKTVDLGTYGTHTLRVANTSTPSECSRAGFSQTACGFVLEFADIITEHNMNPAGTYKGTQYDYGWNKDGWPASSMYTFVNNDIYNAIPSEIKNAIIDTTVVSGHGKSDTENFTSTDKLYLLAPKEIYSDLNDSYDTAKDLTRTLDYYTNIRVTTSSYSGAIKYKGTSADNWWLRAANYINTINFLYVNFDGNCYTNTARTTYGVAPAFRLG